MANSKACTIDNVIGSALGGAELEAADIPFSEIQDLDAGGVATFHETVNRIQADAYNAASRGRETSFEDQLMSDMPKGMKGAFMAFLAELKNPSRVLGEELVGEMNAFIEDLHAEFFGDLPAGLAEYKAGVADILDNVDISQYDPVQRYVFKKYDRFYRDGGELYGIKNTGKVDEAISNLTSNVIKSSPTVVLGNIAEGAIKLPTLYPKEFLPALMELTAKGELFKKIPEFEKVGVYGIHYAGEELGKWPGVMALTDVPLKNIAGRAAEMAGQRPSVGVQKIAFVQRFGDMPLVYSYPTGRQAMKFLSYTMNMYKMYAGMWQGLANPKTMGQSLYQLTAYHALAAAIGGGTAAVPGAFQSTIEAFFPDTKEWFNENSNMMTKLIQPGDFSRVGIGFDIASRQMQRAGKNVNKAGEHLNEGNMMGAMLDLADTGFAAASITQSPVGDLNAQKILQMARDVMEGELELEDVPEEALKKVTPWNR